jgi:hypothetical protein
LQTVGGLDPTGLTAYLNSPPIQSYLGFDPNSGCASWQDVNSLGGGGGGGGVTPGQGLLAGNGTSTFWLNTPGAAYIGPYGNPQVIQNEGLVYVAPGGNGNVINIPTDYDGMVLTAIGGEPRWAMPSGGGGGGGGTVNITQNANQNLDGIVGRDINSYTVEYKIKKMVLTDGTTFMTVTNIGPIRASIHQTGLNGIDSGTVSYNTWYYVYLVYYPEAQSAGLLISRNPDKPAMQANYTFFAKIGIIHAGISSNTDLLIGFHQSGTRFDTKVMQISPDNVAIPNGYSQIKDTYFAITNVVPPNGLTVSLELVLSNSSTNGQLLQISGGRGADETGEMLNPWDTFLSSASGSRYITVRDLVFDIAKSPHTLTYNAVGANWKSVHAYVSGYTIAQS